MDKYFHPLSNKKTIMHQLDPRVKLLGIISFILISTTLKSYLGLLVVIILLLTFLWGSGMSFLMLVKRLGWVFLFGGALIILFPFITPGSEIYSWHFGKMVIAATHEGIAKAIFLFLRLLSAVLAVTLLNATTGFGEVVDSFRKLHMPELLVSILEFTVRYFFVLYDELTRMKLARKARSFDFEQSIFQKNALKTIVQMIVALFVRSMERAERVYLAMLARGYNGKFAARETERIPTADLFWGTGFVLLIIGVKCFEAGGLIG